MTNDGEDGWQGGGSTGFGFSCGQEIPWSLVPGRIDPEKRVLDYGRPPLKEALWFRLLVLFGCLLGVGIIIAMVLDRIRHG